MQPLREEASAAPEAGGSCDEAVPEPRVPPIRIMIGEAAKRRLSRMNRLQTVVTSSSATGQPAIDAGKAGVLKTYTSGDIEVSVKQFTHSTTKQKRSSITIRRASKSDAIREQTRVNAAERKRFCNGSSINRGDVIRGDSGQYLTIISRQTVSRTIAYPRHYSILFRNYSTNYSFCRY